ncbi:LlaJI family restriction endonuclease, partial [Eubacterium sp.]|uniref:LlaJI family restriction endonuclease n=1 Tax=Eubacterium sp. TaxID=142586 RepID=UPI002589202E
PVYLDLYTKEQTIDTSDFFKQLHERVITSCSKQLEEAELSEVFNMPIIHLSERELDSLGDEEYILDRIDIELTQQFDDRKINVLKAIREYIQRAGKMQESEDVALLFGTRAFHEVWEEIINVVFGNQSEFTFGEIKRKYVSSIDYSIHLPNGSTEFVTSEIRLDKIIEKPEWHMRKEKGSNQLVKYMPQKTFIPDYLHFANKGDEFYILDAKYYDPKTYVSSDGNLIIEKQPSVEDVTKQYMYYLVYRRLLDHNNITVEHVKNYFIMPSEDEDADMGYAKLNVFGSFLPKIFDIRVKKLNATKLYMHYINDEKLDVSTIP